MKGLSRGMAGASKISQEDADAILSAVGRFCSESIAPRVERPDEVLAQQDLSRLTGGAIEAGILNIETEEAFGLWENADCTSGVHLTTAALRVLGEVNAGVAFHFHQLALGGWLLCQVSPASAGRSVACVQGTYGLGRHVLARFLKGAPLSDSDAALVAEYFGTGQGGPLLLQVGDDWEQVLAPAFDPVQQQLSWELYARDGLTVESIPNSHGLNETLTWQWSRGSGETPVQRADLEPKAARMILAEAMGFNALAAMAIGLGSVKGAHTKAREYAGLRVQGGGVIANHPAVQLMLGTTAGAIRVVDAVLDSLAAGPVDLATLPTILSARATVHPLLCEAANAALQVFGGTGYMQDTGLEKIVRDNNHLRLLFGAPNDIRLFLAEWERLS